MSSSSWLRVALCVLGLVALLQTASAQRELAGSTLHIDSPMDFQVFQRDSLESGLMHVGGFAPVGSRVDVRIKGSPFTGRLPRGWRKLPVDPAGRFDAEFRTAAGGFYSVTLRARPKHGPRSSVEIPHVGVGEVFVIAGQSNSTNYGEVQQKVLSGLVSTFDGTRWRIADDPQPGTQDNSKKGSFIPAFGDAMVRRFRVPVGVASVGHGSTSVRQWLPAGTPVEVMPTMTRFIAPGPNGTLLSDGTLFRGLMLRIQQLGPHGFRSLLWHQGESDAHQSPDHQIPASTYRRMMVELIQASRRDAGWDFPWFVAQATYHSPEDTSSPELRDAQRSLWQSGFALQGPDTDTLTGAKRQNGGKGVHLSGAGLQAHGRMWADKVGDYLDTVLRSSSSR